MKKCLVVYNPNSGKYNKEVTLPKIEKILNEYDYSVIIEKTKYKGDANRNYFEWVANLWRR